MNTTDTTATTGIFNYSKWEQHLAQNIQAYRTADPYPHIQLDNFLEPAAAEQARAEFPSIKDQGWIHYVHLNEKKHGLNKMELLPPFIQKVIHELNSPEFTAYLSKLTGIDNLLSDDLLEGGGLHQSKRNGFLNVHADFTVHPHKPHWRRRVNLLIYLNKDWKEAYKGDLELWDRDMKGVRKKILPIFNRCVIFNTDADSYHGVPDPIMCPEDDTRKSIALYYFTEESAMPVMRSTNYRARPQDGLKSIGIYLDKKMVAVYTGMKRRLGINDDFISKLLNIFKSKK
jgi:Rps23 Pro-64 3,4-dihydroxylase Tpa1-like proline 4-hydroxylase